METTNINNNLQDMTLVLPFREVQYEVHEGSYRLARRSANLPALLLV